MWFYVRPQRRSDALSLDVYRVTTLDDKQAPALAVEELEELQRFYPQRLWVRLRPAAAPSPPTAVLPSP